MLGRHSLVHMCSPQLGPPADLEQRTSINVHEFTLLFQETKQEPAKIFLVVLNDKVINEFIRLMLRVRCFRFHPAVPCTSSQFHVLPPASQETSELAAFASSQNRGKLFSEKRIQKMRNIQ